MKTKERSRKRNVGLQKKRQMLSKETTAEQRRENMELGVKGRIYKR